MTKTQAKKISIFEEVFVQNYLNKLLLYTVHISGKANEFNNLNASIIISIPSVAV